MGNYASGDQRAATVSFSKNCFLIILPATARILREPPGADPHAGWCGGWGGDPPGYPISRLWAVYTRNYIDFELSLVGMKSKAIHGSSPITHASLPGAISNAHPDSISALFPDESWTIIRPETI
jgi:hypothetical protein